jgi:hypothetical protein
MTEPLTQPLLQGFPALMAALMAAVSSVTPSPSPCQCQPHVHLSQGPIRVTHPLRHSPSRCGRQGSLLPQTAQPPDLSTVS